MEPSPAFRPDSQQAASDHTPSDRAEQLRMLRAFGQTPAEVAQRLKRELSAFETTAAALGGQWHQVLPGRAWTVAQESDHIIRVNAASAKIAGLLLSDKPLRAVPQTPGTLLGGKRQAPASLEPGPEQPWEQLHEHHTQTRSALLAAAQAAPAQDNPDRTFFHPFMGELGALDWLRMAAYHTRHHRKQLEQLRS